MSKIIGCKFDRDEIVVYGRPKRPIDTHKSKVLEEEERKIRRDDVIIVNTDFTNDAKFYVDDSCFDDNKMSSNVKWSVVYQHAFADAKIKGENVPSELWALNEGDTSIGYFGMNKHYKQGESLTVKLLGDSKSMYYYGYIQKVFVFTDKPEGGFTFCIIPVSKPCINFAHFENSEKNWQYGDVVNLSVHYHNLCPTGTEELYTQVFVIEDKGSNASITAEEGSSIDFDDLEKISVWKSDELTMPQIDKQSRGLNAFKEFTILIDYEKWRKGEVKEKKFSVIAVVYREEYNWGFKSYKVVAFRNFLAQPTTDLYQYDSKTLSVKDIDIKEGSISSRIRVEKDFMSEILAKREIEKNNMIQYIGDIKYTKREFDPCGYKRIKVKSGDREVYLFDEDKTNISSIDHTSRYFDIIAGDSPKEVVITVEGLQHAPNHLCTGVLLPAGQKHDSWEKVFQMGHVHPAEKGERGYKTKADDTDINHPDDRDVYASTSKGVSVNVADVQMLTFGEDYFKASDQAIELKLGYRYNKTFLEPYTFGLSKSVADNLWLFRYFWLSEKLAQTYFVPISTCRYPNQLAKIRVFPDIEWLLSLKLSSTVPNVYSHTNMPSGITYQHHQERGIEAGQNRRRLNKEVSFELVVKATTDSAERSIGIAYEDKIEPFLEALVKVKEVLDDIIGVSSARNGMAESIANGLPDFLGKKPITFQLDYPVVSIEGGWKYGFDSSKKNIETQGKLAVALTPLIKGTGNLDLIACAEFIPPAKPIIMAIRTATKAVGFDIWFNLYAFGQIDINYTFLFGAIGGIEPLNIATTVGIGAELGVKASAEVPKLSFGTETKDSINLGFEASAKGETSLIISGKQGSTTEGVYLELSIGFGGLEVIVTAKASVWKMGVGFEDEPYKLIEPKPDLLKGRFYIIKANNDKE